MQDRQAHDQQMDRAEMAHLTDLAELRQRFAQLQSKDNHTPEELAQLDALRNQVIQYQVWFNTTVIKWSCSKTLVQPTSNQLPNQCLLVCTAAWCDRALPTYTMECWCQLQLFKSMSAV